MAGRNTVVYGIYSHRSQAEAGVDRLLGAGFRKEDISVLLEDNAGTKDFAHVKETKAPEGASLGAIAGGVIGGAFGLLVGAGAILIPGLGPLIAAGPVIGALTGVGSGGIVGGIVGALVGMGIPEYEAKRFEGHIRKGGILASVHCDNSEWVSKAKMLLKQTGADDIASAAEAKADFAVSDRPYLASDMDSQEPILNKATRTPPPQAASSPAPPTSHVAPLPIHEAGSVSRVRIVPASNAPIDDVDFRRHFQTSVGGQDYNSYAPAYQYGYHAASDPRFHGRSFEEAEPELRTEYVQRYPGAAWETMRDSVRYGWSKISGTRAAAASGIR